MDKGPITSSGSDTSVLVVRKARKFTPLRRPIIACSAQRSFEAFFEKIEINFYFALVFTIMLVKQFKMAGFE